MWDVVWMVSLVLACVAGVVLTAVRLPGIWLIVFTGWGYGWYDGWQTLSLTLIIVLTGVAVVAEVVEALMSVVFARKAGASSKAAWGALIGGFVGMLVFTIPLPVIGTTIGAILGCFTGALVVEWGVRKDVGQGLRVGVFSAIGFTLGIVTKLLFAFALSAVLLTSVVCSSGVPDNAAIAQEPADQESMEAPDA